MSMSEYTPRRLKSAIIKAEQLKATGAKYVCTSCHNCVDGLTDLIRHYKLDMKVVQLVNLVANALVVEERPRVVIPAAVHEELPLAGKKIVVVDDEPDFATFVATVLEDAGAKVFIAHDADSAFALVKEEKPDLMTLDLAMPGKTGDKVFVDMRHDPELKSIPVCIISGQPEMRSLIYDRPVPPPEGYLDKPVNEDHILMNIKKILKIPHHE